MEHIRIIRHANEGFDTKTHDFPFHFYSGVITDYNQRIELDLNNGLLSPKIHKLSGCYCHFYKYDRASVTERGILGTRYKDKINVAYLPADYPVFVRNMNPQRESILSYYSMVQNPNDLSWHRFDKSGTTDIYDWVRMPLSVAVARNEEYLSLENITSPSEAMSEIFLVEEDIKQLVNKKRYGRFKAVDKIPLMKTF